VPEKKSGSRQKRNVMVGEGAKTDLLTEPQTNFNPGERDTATPAVQGEEI